MQLIRKFPVFHTKIREKLHYVLYGNILYLIKND